MTEKPNPTILFSASLIISVFSAIVAYQYTNVFFALAGGLIAFAACLVGVFLYGVWYGSKGGE